jgi:dTDP-4-amino-4,6-dideoxygalactose transaminase
LKAKENEERKKLIEELAERGVGSMCYYPVPLHLQVAFKKLGYKKGAFPITEQVANEVLSLPMYPELTTEDVIYVANQITEVMTKLSGVVPAPVMAPTFLGA